eukprot:TRINITY_DN3860_c0_g2_i1.p1 TRINITY_DN3860_c0_g2~~TRINITY_DN3860_c0_g2_i1.p1  ORF type:complete len:943 (+),score=176.29 TRINITY_DN3860_c0_g2_i1:97-2925(+)
MQQHTSPVGDIPEWRQQAPRPRLGDGFQGLCIAPPGSPWGGGVAHAQSWGMPTASAQLPAGPEPHGGFHAPSGRGTSLHVGVDALAPSTAPLVQPLPQGQPLSSFVVPPLGALQLGSQATGAHSASTDRCGGAQAFSQKEGHVSQEPSSLPGPGQSLGVPLSCGVSLPKRPESGASIAQSVGRDDGGAVGSSQGFEGGAARLVPIEYANSKVWEVTSEYENLLNVQRDQHQLTLRQRNAEIAHLQHTVEAVQSGRGKEDHVVAHLRGEREEACQLALEGTRKELALFASLLHMRDRQIGELQQMCALKQDQMLELQERLDTTQRAALRESSAANAAAVAAPSQGSSTQEVQALRQEKAELERLLVTKDRQMEATLRAIDPKMADTSALQLGAQAVQMFHDSMKMRADTESLDEENKRLREELERSQGHVDGLEAEVTERRAEIKELMNTIAAKVQRALELEASREMEVRERRKESKETATRQDKMQDEIADLTEEVNTKQLFIEQLQDELSERDQRLLQQRADALHHRACAKRFEQKAEETEARLVGAEETLSEMLQDSKHKDQLVRELTEQVNASETKLHAFHINELMSHRKRNLEQQSKGASTALPLALAPELHSTDKEMMSSRLTNSKGKTMETSFESMFGNSGLNQSLNGCGGLGYGGVAQSGMHEPLAAFTAATAMAGDPSRDLLAPHAGVTDSSNVALRQLPGKAGSAMSSQCASQAQTPVSYGSHQLYGGQAVRLMSTATNLRGGLSGAGTSSVGAIAAGTSAASDFAPSRLVRAASHGHLSSSGASAGGGSHLHRAIGSVSDNNNFLEFNGAVNDGLSSGKLSLQNYRPHPGDTVDRKVAEFVNEPQNSSCQALFCRLGPGSYLYGTQRASLRVDPTTEHLEALHGNDWVPIEDFARRMEDSQGIHIRRAREATVGTLGGSVTIPIAPGRGGRL